MGKREYFYPAFPQSGPLMYRGSNFTDTKEKVSFNILYNRSRGPVARKLETVIPLPSFPSPKKREKLRSNIHVITMKMTAFVDPRSSSLDSRSQVCSIYFTLSPFAQNARFFDPKLDKFVTHTKRVPKCCLFLEPTQSNENGPQNARNQL